MTTRPRSVRGIIDDASARAKVYATRGIDDAFFSMTQTERDEFDAWLVSIHHVLASEAGTQERRFRSFISDLVTGRYKGQMP